MGNCCETEQRGFHQQHGYIEPGYQTQQNQPKIKTTGLYEQFDDDDQKDIDEKDPLLATITNGKSKNNKSYNLFSYENNSESPITRAYQEGDLPNSEEKPKKRNKRRKSVRFDLPVVEEEKVQELDKQLDKEEVKVEEDDQDDNIYTSSMSASSSTSRGGGSGNGQDSNGGGPIFPQGMRKAGIASSLVAEAKKARYKSSSTATMFLKSTLSSPDVDELIKCLAYAMHLHMQAAEDVSVSMLEKKEANIFDEDQFPLMREPGLTDTRNPPSIEHVYKFIHTIFTVERLSHECAILCLAYVERMMTNSRVRLRPHTWRRIVLGALILASKVWEDQAVWNVDFLAVFPAVTVKDLGRLEAKYLNLLSFSVGLKASVYAKYYFELRDLSDKDESNFPLKPLDKDGQRRLEERSLSEQERISRRAAPTRSQSADFGVSPRSPPAVLN